MLIEYWSDYSCPFCYIAETRLKRVMREMGVEDQCRLDFRAFRLNPGAKKVPRHTMVHSISAHYGIPVEQAQMQVDRVDEMARAEGLEFSYGTSYNCDTLDALRLTKLALSKGKAVGDAFIERMYDAFFGDNLVVADRGVLLGICAEFGIDGKEAEDVLDSDMFLEDVVEDEDTAHRLGVDAVPFFVINGKYGVPGAVDDADFKRILETVLDEEENSDLEGMKGMACGPDGCK